VAPTPATVLILGDSGTGKELVAQALHRNSTRAAGPFVAINCAALPESLLESELFGHVRGSFTGAHCDRKGKIAAANSGSLFLDEIGELPLPLQSKLLRVLQEHAFEPVGSTRAVHVDIRVIAATNANLQNAIDRGAFREDLYFRLNVVSLRLPPLRERRVDIPDLAAHFAERCCCDAGIPPVRISSDAMHAMCSHSWRGNVRELRNVIERAIVLGTGRDTGIEDLPEELRNPQAPQQNSYHGAVRQFKRELLQSAITTAAGNLRAASRILDLNPTYLHRLVRSLGVKPKDS
jgi:transcriptional regulator with GAF, ATPase, and Fis domain